MRLSVGTGIGPFRVSQTLYRTRRHRQRGSRSSSGGAGGTLLVELFKWTLIATAVICVLSLLVSVALAWALVLGVTWLIPATRGWSRARALDTEAAWARRRGRVSRRARAQSREVQSRAARDAELHRHLTEDDEQWLRHHRSFSDVDPIG